MTESIQKRIANLNIELTKLREERDKLDSNATKWAETRDALHEEIRELRKEVGNLRQRRDQLNEKVQALKRLREKAKLERNEKHAQIAMAQEKIAVLKKNRSSPKNLHDIRKEIEDLEWKIQTTAYTLKEEKQLTDQVGALEVQLRTQERLQESEKTLLELRVEEKALQTRAKTHHENLSRLADQSQGSHQQMLETSKRAQALQKEADEAHQKYIERRQQARTLNQKCQQLLEEIKTLREKIREVEDEKRANREMALRKELEEKALEKLKRGEKLTWEEFQALSEKGLV